MKKTIAILASFSVLVLGGCAELSAVNNKIGDIAGQLNQALGVTASATKATTYEGSEISKRDIDTLYLKIKRKFNFETMDEMMSGCSMKNKNCIWRKAAIEQNGYIHDRQPGVYYHLLTGYDDGDKIEVILEKSGKSVDVTWKVKTRDKSFAEQIKKDMLKIIK